MKTLIEGYGKAVRDNIDFVCKLQTWIAIIAAGLVLAVNEHLSKGLGQLAIILVLFSIPSAAWLAKIRIRNYETSIWRETRPDLDFSGRWKFEGRFLQAFRLLPHEPLPPSLKGDITVEQTPFWISLNSGRLVSTVSHADLGGWSWLSAAISEGGKQIYAAYKVDEMPDPALKTLRSEGYGVDSFTVTEWDPPASGTAIHGRPRVMRNHWYDCVRENDAVLFIGEATLRRVDS
jgi:hypothetical protein